MLTSCVNDLDTVPIDKDDLVSSVVFGNEIGAYEESLAKIYAGLVIGGNKGGDDEQDVVGIDGGSQRSSVCCGTCRSWLPTWLTVVGTTPVSPTSTISVGQHPHRG